MQADLWLTETRKEDRCPLCNSPLTPGANTCFACGFNNEPARNSSVWIDPAVQMSPARYAPAAVWQPRTPGSRPHTVTSVPPRASAPDASRSPSRQPKSYVSPTARPPQPPQRRLRTTENLENREVPGDTADNAAAMWQYESPNYEAAGSLPILSLLAPEAPTQPQAPISPNSPNNPVDPVEPRRTRRLPDIDEIDTVPPIQPRAQPRQQAPFTGLEQLAAQPTSPVGRLERGERVTRRLNEPAYPSLALVPMSEASPAPVLVPAPMQFSPAQDSPLPLVVEHLPPAVQEDASWTAGQASDSPYARLIASPASRNRLRLANPLDSLRWWLLRPGRIEFTLWLGGTLLLVLVTCALLFAFAFSFQSVIPGSSLPFPGGIGDRNASGANAQTALSERLALGTTGQITPGEQIDVRGNGFSRNGLIRFYFDGTTTMIDAHAKPAQTKASAQGSFEMVLWLGVGNAWNPGKHTIFALDVATGRRATLPITLSNGTTKSSTLASSSHTPGPSTTSTSSSSSPTAPGATPTLTPAPQGSPVNKTPVPTTPTPKPSPSPSHTPSTTPTASVTPTLTATAGTSPTATAGTTSGTPTNNASLSNALNQSGEPPIGTPFVIVSPLVWIMVGCYALSMIFLGIAGLLFKRRASSLQ